jgi:phospholipase/lecithinase/hemolysin
MIGRERAATFMMVRWTAAVCLALVLAAPGRAAAQSRFSGIVVFGTSLSDSGNAFALGGEAATPPDFMLNPLLVPAVPYARGGHHFTNGATWIEQYGTFVGLSGSVRPAFSNQNASNYAVGAARAREDGVNFNLTRQVDAFLERTGNTAPAQALYVIEMGSNDIRDAFGVYVSGGNGGPILTQAIGSIAANIQRLYTAGAREFLVWAAPNVALTPAIRSLPPAAGSLAGSLTQLFNNALAGVLAQLTSNLPGSNVVRLDVYRLLNEIAADPAQFNLANVTTACLTPNLPPFSCVKVDDYLFWDGIHPTNAGHAILADEAAKTVQ